MLLPIFAPIFLAGFILSSVSEPKARNALKRIATPALKAQPSKKDTLEMGLIQELAEEPIVTA